MTFHTQLGTDRAALRYALHLTALHRRELGFIPSTSYEAMVAARRLRLAAVDEDPVGILLVGPIKRDTRVYQACVQEDARRIYHGSGLLTELVQEATAAGAHRISLWCASDLPSNAFWQACGFARTRSRVKSKRTGRPQTEWTLMLPGGLAWQRQLSDDPRTLTVDQICKFAGVTLGSRMQMQEKMRKDRL